jgi:hypothetical protein
VRTAAVRPTCLLENAENRHGATAFSYSECVSTPTRLDSAQVKPGFRAQLPCGMHNADGGGSDGGTNEAAWRYRLGCVALRL